QTAPEWPTSLAYQDMVGELRLSRDPARMSRPVELTLTLAADAVRARPLVPRTPPPPPAPVRKKSSARIPRVRVPAPVAAAALHSSPAESGLVPPSPPERLPVEKALPPRPTPPVRVSDPTPVPPPAPVHQRKP